MPRRNNRAYDHQHHRDPHRPNVPVAELRWRYRQALHWATETAGLERLEAQEFAAWFMDAYEWVIPAYCTNWQAYHAWQDLREAMRALGPLP
jgi:hypothetical protein